MGNRGIRPFISGEQGNQSLKLKGTGEQRQFWGTGNIENQVWFWGIRENADLFQRNKGTGTPLWEGLSKERPVTGSWNISHTDLFKVTSFNLKSTFNMYCVLGQPSFCQCQSSDCGKSCSFSCQCRTFRPVWFMYGLRHAKTCLRVNIRTLKA